MFGLRARVLPEHRLCHIHRQDDVGQDQGHQWGSWDRSADNRYKEANDLAPLSEANPKLSTTKRLKIGDIEASGTTVRKKALQIDTTSIKTSDTATFLWENIGTDAADDAIDMQLIVSDITAKADNKTYKKTHWFPILYVKGGKLAACSWYNNKEKGWFGIKYKVSVKFLKHNSTTSAKGNYVFAARDIDVNRFEGFHETITLKSGFEDNIYISKNSYFDTKDVKKGIITRDDGSKTSGGDVRTMFAARTGASFSFTWKGKECQTILFSPQLRDVKISLETEHAKIDNKAYATEKTQTHAWKWSHTYTCTPDPGYYLSYIYMNCNGKATTEKYNDDGSTLASKTSVSKKFTDMIYIPYLSGPNLTCDFRAFCLVNGFENGGLLTKNIESPPFFENLTR